MLYNGIEGFDNMNLDKVNAILVLEDGSSYSFGEKKMLPQLNIPVVENVRCLYGKY